MSSGDSHPVGQYLDELVEAAPPMETLLQEVRKEVIFCRFIVAAQFAAETGITLSQSQIEVMLDPDHVAWDWFHIQLLESSTTVPPARPPLPIGANCTLMRSSG